MIFKDNNDRIYLTFDVDFALSSETLWSEFINSLDLGIHSTAKNNAYDVNVYTIVDEKKWCLSRIKYGI